MANHKRRRPKNRRSGCLMCKPHKANGFKHQIKVKGLKGKVDIRQPAIIHLKVLIDDEYQTTY